MSAQVPARDHQVLGLPRAGLRPKPVWFCRVDAAGVCAEWVETTKATIDQPTLVCFLDGDEAATSLELGRPLAKHLARATRARVLTVCCRRGPDASPLPAVEDGVAAYVWLLGEGCDVGRTAFISGTSRRALALAVLKAIRDRGFPAPEGGIHSAASLWGKYDDLAIERLQVSFGAVPPIVAKVGRTRSSLTGQKWAVVDTSR